MMMMMRRRSQEEEEEEGPGGEGGGGGEVEKRKRKRIGDLIASAEPSSRSEGGQVRLGTIVISLCHIESFDAHLTMTDIKIEEDMKAEGM